MTFTLHTESPYVVTEDQQSEGDAGSHTPIFVDPTPRVSISGGNARLIRS